MVPAWVLAPERSYSWRAQTCLSLTSCTWCWTYFPAKVISTGDWVFLGVGGWVLWEEPPTLRSSPWPSRCLDLAPPSDDAEQVWVWEYETEEGAHDLYMDTGEEIRFRVVDESFVDTSPSGPSSAEATTSSEELPKKEAPYTLVVR